MSLLATNMRELADKKRITGRKSLVPKVLKEIEKTSKKGEYSITIPHLLNTKEIQEIKNEGFKVAVTSEKTRNRVKKVLYLIISWE